MGALAYNAAHTTTTYLALAGFGVLTHTPVAVLLGLIGLAHVGLDRALGFGLKYGTAFGDTHLGRGKGV